MRWNDGGVTDAEFDSDVRPGAPVHERDARFYNSDLVDRSGTAQVGPTVLYIPMRSDGLGQALNQLSLFLYLLPNQFSTDFQCNPVCQSKSLSTTQPSFIQPRRTSGSY